MSIEITKDNGEIVTHEYLVRRVSAHLSRLRRVYTLEERRAAIAETVNNPQWMRRHNGQTVGSICRAVFAHI